MSIKQRIIEYLDLEISSSDDSSAIIYSKVKEFVNHLEDGEKAPINYTYSHCKDHSSWDVIADDEGIGWITGKIGENLNTYFSVSYETVRHSAQLGSVKTFDEAKQLIECYHEKREFPAKSQPKQNDFKWTIIQEQVNFSDLKVGDFFVEASSLQNDDVWMVKETEHFQPTWKVIVVTAKNVLSGVIQDWVCSGRIIIHKVDRDLVY